MTVTKPPRGLGVPPKAKKKRPIMFMACSRSLSTVSEPGPPCRRQLPIQRQNMNWRPSAIYDPIDGQKLVLHVVAVNIPIGHGCTKSGPFSDPLIWKPYFRACKDGTRLTHSRKKTSGHGPIKELMGTHCEYPIGPYSLRQCLGRFQNQRHFSAILPGDTIINQGHEMQPPPFHLACHQI